MAPSVKSHKRACVSQPTPRSRTHTSTTLHQSWPPEQTQVLIPQIAFCVFGWEWARDRPLIVCCTYSQVVTKKKVPLSLRGNTEHNTGPQSNLSSRVLILVQPQDLRGLTCPMRLLYRDTLKEVATISAGLQWRRPFADKTYFVLNMVSVGSLNSPTVGCGFRGDDQCSLCCHRLSFRASCETSEMRKEE